MSGSDDEDDFLSADEEGFGDVDKPKTLVRKNSVPDLKGVEQATRHLGEKTIRTKALNDEEVIDEVKSNSREVKKQDTKRNDDPKGGVVVDDYDDVDKPRASCDSTYVKKDTSKVDLDDEEEEAVLERVRERNLRIARKFSAELAKNIKASAPIPVRGANPIDFKIDDIDYPSNLESGSVPSPPPPTPALSSSFNSEEPSTSGTTYGWRVPSVQRARHFETSTPELGKTEQTSLVLDRLAEKFSQNDKNLFEKIVDDVTKVSIKSEKVTGDQQVSSAGGSITELGHTFSNWTWNWGSEAGSKLLASASQVTNQVGSVLDSVVNVSSHPFIQQPENSQVDESAQKVTKQKEDGNEGSISSKSKPKMDASEAASNDALVDFTLNAMESLGKKAFSVMTERDESGSLQIKGLGRPWENLMPVRTSRKPVQRKDSSAEVEPELEPGPVEFSSTTEDRNMIKSSDEQVTLKNRKKHFNRDE